VNSVRKIEIEVPEELLMNLKQSDEEFKKELKLLMAIDLYKKSRLSLGKAAELSGFSKLGFIDMLNFRGEPVFNYSEDEISRELQNIKSLDILKGDSNEGHM
jgi:predicted HTH domain antitoxin